jgi:hypoxia up-regulated 1
MENKRAVNRLLKESIRAKEVLSANKEAHVTVAELVDYDTLKTKIDRTELEVWLEAAF